MSYRPTTNDYALANRDALLPSFVAIDFSSTHRDAPQSAAFVLGDLHCKALPVERILTDVVASRRGGQKEGQLGRVKG